MSSAANEPIALWSRVQHAGAALAALSVQERAHGLAKAAASLSRPAGQLLSQLGHSACLSEPMVRWALASTFEAFTEDALLALMRDAQRERAASVAAVLAGNVLTACARPMLLPLLAGVPVVAKASLRDDVLPHAIARALSAAHPILGSACAVVSFSHSDVARMGALLAPAACVQVLGSDEAVASVRARLRQEQVLLGRGHGLGLGLVRSAAPPSAARDVALDVAAYDQRGCLSPHAIVVEGDDAAAEAFAARLFEALCALEHQLPRGPMPSEAAAEQLQWRAVALARGTLHEGASCAVSCEHGHPLRPSPGYRNVSVYTLGSLAALPERALPFSRFLKALGVAGPREGVPSLAPYPCRAGAMQTPPLSAALDGLRPLAGFA